MEHVADVYPLTPTQEGVLFQSLRSGDPELYFEQVRATVRGKFDTGRYRQAWEAVISAHPALRTAFVWKGVKQPVRVVHRQVEAEWDIADRRLAAPSGRELDRIARNRRRRGFDLQRAPLMRFLVVLLDDDTTHLVWDFHHVLLDGWSAASVFDQVLDRYENPDQAVAVSVASPREHQKWLMGRDRTEAEQHWAELLKGMDPSQRLGIGRSEDGTGANRDSPFRLGRLDRELDGDLSADLIETAANHRVTINTLVHAAWALVVERAADSDDVVFGAVSSGRPAEVDGMDTAVGMFLTTLPVRIDVAGGQPLAGWLRSVQNQQLDLLSNQHVSLADLRPFTGADVGTDPFDSVVVFENYPRRDTSASEQVTALEVLDRWVFEQTHYDLTLMVMPGERVALSVLYNAERFDERDIVLLVELFRRRLEILTRTPLDTPLRPLELSSAADELADELIGGTSAPVEVAGPEVDLPALDMSDLLERVSPDTSAFVDEDGTVLMTHGGLWQAAAAVTGCLEDLAVGPGSVVAVASGHGPVLASASIAAWTLGATVLGLDPDDPRNPDLVRQSGADAVIDADGVVAGGAPGIGADAETDAIDSNGAVLVFTSGSTGTPKPVVVTHQGLVNRIAWQHRQHPFAAGEVALAKTSLAFVDHLWELWGPLTAGCPVVAVSDPSDLRRVIGVVADLPVRRLVLVPSLLEALLDLGDETVRALGSLEWLTVSGERLTAALADRVAERLPAVRLVNLYGMSEATADITCCEISTTDRQTWLPAGPPIGVPIDNLRIRLTDRHGRAGLPTAPGEIQVAGVGLSAGVADVDGPSVGWYRTGDRGRWRSDGSLDYLGRLDRQVKIRGVRVHPDQVEAVLRADDSVAEAAVAVVDGALRAWVEPRPGFDESALRSRLGRRLISQAVPQRFEICRSWPRTVSGKFDRAALIRGPGTAPTGDSDVASFASGTTETRRREASAAEKEMIEIWEDVIGPDSPIGPEDDFFEIGGDSLTALRLFSRVDKRYGVELALAQVFDAPTPAEMVELLDKANGPRLLILAENGDPLARRLASGTRPEVFRPGVVEPDELAERWLNGSDEPVAVLAHGREAGMEAKRMVSELNERGCTVGLLALVAAGEAAFSSEFRDDTGEAVSGPKAIVRFEPAEAEGRRPLLTAAETRKRLGEGPGSSLAGSAKAEIVMVPGTPETVLQEPSVSWLAQLVLARLSGASADNHLVVISRNEAAPPERTIYAVHGEFGNVVGYRDLAVALGDDWSLVGVQASGVQGVEPLHSSIEDMAAAYLEQILRRQPNGPYLIGGYSAGGTIAMEMVRQLEEAGRPVSALLWFDHFRVGAVQQQSRLERVVQLGRHRLGELRRQGRAELAAGLTRRRVKRLAEQVIGGREDWWWQITRLASDRAEAEMVRAELLQANIRRVRRLYADPQIGTPIVLYEAEEIDAGRRPDRGWSDDEFSIERVAVPGNHSTALLAPHVEAIADDIRGRFGS